MWQRLTSRWFAVPAITAAVVAILFANPGREDALEDSAYESEPLRAARQALELRKSKVAHRIAYKDLLIRELLAERLTFDQVTDEFLFVNRQDEITMSTVRMAHPDCTDLEANAINVLGYIKTTREFESNRDVMTKRMNENYTLRFGHAPQPW